MMTVKAKSSRGSGGSDLNARALALVTKTRADLGAPDEFGEEIAGDDGEIEPLVFDLEFLKTLNQIHGERITRIRDLTRQSELEEMEIVVSGISSFLSQISQRYPGTARVTNKCRNILTDFTKNEYNDSSSEDYEDEEKTEPYFPRDNNGIPVVPKEPSRVMRRLRKRENGQRKKVDDARNMVDDEKFMYV